MGGFPSLTREDGGIIPTSSAECAWKCPGAQLASSGSKVFGDRRWTPGPVLPEGHENGKEASFGWEMRVHVAGTCRTDL